MLFVVFICVYLLSYSQAQATSLVLSGVPESREVSESFPVDVSFSGSKGSCANKIYYLRAAFFKEGSIRYFGFTFNHNGAWVENPESKTDYYQFTTNEEGSWSGKLYTQPNPLDSGFSGTGNYLLKVGRYTENGSSVTEWSNTVSLLLASSPTPAPTATPTEAPSTPQPTAPPPSTPAPTAVMTPKPNSTPKLTATPNATDRPNPTAYPSNSPDATESAIPEEDSDSDVTGSVAGMLTSDPETGENQTGESPPKTNKIIPLFMTIGGVSVLAGALPLGMKLIKGEE